MPPLETRIDAPGETPEVPHDPCQHWRGILRFRHRLHTRGQSPCELLRGLSGFPSLRCRGLRACVVSVPKPEDSSPVPTWILGYFWSRPKGVSPRLEWGHTRALSSRAVTAVSRFLRRGSSYLWLSLEAFTRGCPKRLSHRAVPRATVV